MSPVFDEAKYRALLEKLEVSEVKISDIDESLRIDSWQCPEFCAHFILTDYQNHVRFVYYITKIPFYKRDIDEFPILS